MCRPSALTGRGRGRVCGQPTGDTHENEGRQWEGYSVPHHFERHGECMSRPRYVVSLFSLRFYAFLDTGQSTVSWLKWFIFPCFRRAASTRSWRRLRAGSGKRCCRTSTSSEDAWRTWWSSSLGSTRTWSRPRRSRRTRRLVVSFLPTLSTLRRTKITNFSTPKKTRWKLITSFKCQSVTDEPRQESAQTLR